MNEENVEIMENDKNEIEEVSSSGNQVIYYVAAGLAAAVTGIIVLTTKMVRKARAAKAQQQDEGDVVPKEKEHMFLGYKITKIPKVSKEKKKEISEEE